MAAVRRTRRTSIGIGAAIAGLIATAGAVVQPSPASAEDDPPWFGGRLLVTRDGDGNHQQLWDPGTLETTPWRWQEGFGIGVFSHDGALFASRTGQRSAELRHPDGTVESLGRIPLRQPELPDDDLTFDIQLLDLGFTDSSDTVVAISAANGTGEHYHQHPFLWRMEAGQAPVRIAYLGDYVDAQTTAVTHPESPYVYYSEAGGGLGRVDVATGVLEHLSDADLEPLAIEPTSDRVLVHDPGAGALSWYDVGDAALTPWLAPQDPEGLELADAWLTPDGSGVMVGDVFGSGPIEIRAVDDAAVLHSFPLDWDAPGPATLHGWQPCPAATCTDYVPDQKPPAVPDVGVRSGEPGDPSTIRLRWTRLPDEGGGRIVAYEARVVRWRDGEAVRSRRFFFRRWAQHGEPELARGHYRVELRARNYVGNGPWSDPSDVVRAR